MSIGRPIRVLIVDDSPVSSNLLSAILDNEQDMEVIGVAKDGLIALQLTLALKPDLITMDIMMPNMDGVEATRLIMQQRPTPIIILSAQANLYSSTCCMNALNEGALSVIAKPVNIGTSEFKETQELILKSIRALVEVHVVKRRVKNPVKIIPVLALVKPPAYKLLALGTSTGGPQALHYILKSLSPNFPIPIIIAQHITKGFLQGLAGWLQDHIALKIEIATDGQLLIPGRVYFCDEHYHLLINKSKNGPIVELDDSPVYQHFKPSINKLFSSIAQSYPAMAVAGLLTGMGSDGAEGLLQMKNAGCYTFAQSRTGCIAYGMPRVAKEINAIEKCIDLEQIPAQLSKLIMKEKN